MTPTRSTSHTPDRSQTDHARPVRRQRAGGGTQFNLNMTPMIDVVFNLLIYFVLTIGFGMQEGSFESKLPKTHGLVAGDTVPLTPIRVRLQKSGPEPENFTIQVEKFRHTPRSFPELAGMLRDIQSIQGYDAETPVLVIPADQIHWDNVLKAYHAATLARFKNVNFGVQ